MEKAVYLISASLFARGAYSLSDINLETPDMIEDHTQRKRRQNMEVEVAAEYGSNWDVSNVSLFNKK